MSQSAFAAAAKPPNPRDLSFWLVTSKLQVSHGSLGRGGLALLHVTSQGTATLWGMPLSWWVAEAQEEQTKPQEYVCSSCLDVVCVTSAHILLVKTGALAAKPSDNRVMIIFL